MSEIAVRQQPRGLTLADDQETFDRKQIAALTQIGVVDASSGDLAVFFHVCKRTGLDPFARQIHMIGRQVSEKINGEWVKTTKQTIQTGIDGFRLIARRSVDRTGETLSIAESQWCGSDGQWTDVWLVDGFPAAAKVVVYRDGQPFVGTALWREYRQTKFNGDLTSMWEQRGAGQLAKCAEALALRKAFPQDLSGIYGDEEMQRADGAVRPTRRSNLSAALNPHQPVEEHQADDEPVEGEVVESRQETGEQLDTGSPLAKRMFVLFTENGIPSTDRVGRLGYSSDVAGRRIESAHDLTVGEAQRIVEALAADLDVAQHGGQP